MSDELKACSYCGGRAVTGKVGAKEFAFCKDNDCPGHTGGATVKQWNTRPIEDALRKELEEARKLLKDCLDWMEQGRACGDWGNWDWDDDDIYTKARRFIEGSESK